MNRNQFIKSTTLTGLGLTLLPYLSWGQTATSNTTNLLMGKGKPKLFGDDHKLLYEAHQAFEQMKAAARKAGIKIHSVSSYRSFKRQKQIWERKYQQFTQEGLHPTEAIKKIIEYSTVPGTSRHHWGTDLDLIDLAVHQPSQVLETQHFEENGVYCDLKLWLNENAASFQFYEVYTNNPLRKGFKYEPWHFSYAPLSKSMLKDFMQIDVFSILESENLMGSNHFSTSFKEKYSTENILDINPALKP
ncbi:MAG TPA: M15 family metallopeptidase [Flavobacteriaceae bacterium]|nr:M15 family metallopeptidase [Flavobacteriaceae bacterium]